MPASGRRALFGPLFRFRRGWDIGKRSNSTLARRQLPGAYFLGERPQPSDKTSCVIEVASGRWERPGDVVVKYDPPVHGRASVATMQVSGTLIRRAV
jgi:hypothetical protein